MLATFEQNSPYLRGAKELHRAICVLSRNGSHVKMVRQKDGSAPVILATPAQWEIPSELVEGEDGDIYRKSELYGCTVIWKVNDEQHS